jgi:hypothetical protein
LENCTVLSGQTFTPTRCIGKTAALLPAWPNTTWDWMASKWGVRFMRDFRKPIEIRAAQYATKRSLYDRPKTQLS